MARKGTPKRKHTRTSRRGKKFNAGSGMGRALRPPLKARGAYRTTYDVYVNGEQYLNFETVNDARAWLADALQTRTDLRKAKIDRKPRKSRNYRLGDYWRQDFDAVGMLIMGSKAEASWGEPKLQKLFNSFEDVNYHKESEELWEALRLMKGGASFAEIQRTLWKFNNDCKKVLREWKVI